MDDFAAKAGEANTSETATAGFPELDWLARRRAGESIPLIAQRAGVPYDRVRVATERFGPFPQADQQLGRTYLSTVLLGERRQRWVNDRRRGVRVKDIAERDQVSHQTVTRATRGWGPFPSQEFIDAWVEARHDGHSLETIASLYDVRTGIIQRSTAPYGPFLPGSNRPPRGVETRESIAKRAGVSDSAVRNWTHLPEPDRVTAKGRPVWLPSTIDRWLEGKALDRCELCNARPLSLRVHLGQRHADVDGSHTAT